MWDPGTMERLGCLKWHTFISAGAFIIICGAYYITRGSFICTRGTGFIMRTKILFLRGICAILHDSFITECGD